MLQSHADKPDIGRVKHEIDTDVLTSLSWVVKASNWHMGKNGGGQDFRLWHMGIQQVKMEAVRTLDSDTWVFTRSACYS